MRREECGHGSVDAEYLIGSQVMWLFDVTAYHWTKSNEGYGNLCGSYFLYGAAGAGGSYDKDNHGDDEEREVERRIFTFVSFPLTMIKRIDKIMYISNNYQQ